MPTLFFFMMLLNIVSTVLSKRQQCIGDPCPSVGSMGNYYGKKHGLYNIITYYASVFFVNKSNALVKWKPYTLNIGEWTHYRILWGFDYTKPFECALVNLNETSILIRNVHSNWKENDKIHLQVDTYPLPKNVWEFVDGLFSLKALGQNTVTEQTCSFPGNETSTTSSVPPSHDTPIPSRVSSFPDTPIPSRVSSSPETSTTSLVPSSSETPSPSRKLSSPENPIPSQGLSSPENPTPPRKASPENIWQQLLIGCGVALLSVICLFVLLWRRCRDSSRQHKKSNMETRVKGILQLSYMVSYYPESEEYVEKVASVVNWFREAKGYPMIMDKMDTTGICSKGHVRWAESQIQKSDKVLVFLSPGYQAMCSNDDEMSVSASDDAKRVWYEIQLLKTLYCSTRSAAQIVCVLMDEKINTQKLPPWIGMLHRWPKDKDNIIRCLNDKLEIVPSVVSVIEDGKKRYDVIV